MQFPSYGGKNNSFVKFHIYNPRPLAKVVGFEQAHGDTPHG